MAKPIVAWSSRRLRNDNAATYERRLLLEPPSSTRYRRRPSQKQGAQKAGRSTTSTSMEAHCPWSLVMPLAHSGASAQWPSQKGWRTRSSHTMLAISSPPQRVRLTCIACHGGCGTVRSFAARASRRAARLCFTDGLAANGGRAAGSGR